MPIYKVAAKYGVSKAAVSKWKKQLFGRDAVPFMADQTKTEDLSSIREELEAEVSSLKAQIYRLRMERDALEKAAEIIKKARASI